MNLERERFLALLRAGLWNRPTDLPSTGKPTRWDDIIGMASRQTVIGLVADAIAHLPEADRPDGRRIAQLQALVVRNHQAHQRLNRQLVETVNLLRDHGIRPILLKGQGVAQLYSNPFLRQCGDIDLYIGPENYGKARALIEYHYGKDPRNHESLKHYHAHHQGLSIELHRIAERLANPIYNNRFQAWTRQYPHEAEPTYIQINGSKIEIPHPQFNILYIFHHAWHHFISGGIGLRQLCDWSLSLHSYRDTIDQGRLRADLKAFGLIRPWQLFAHIAVERLGLPKEECPFYTNRYAQQAKKALDMIFYSGNFGHHDPARQGRPTSYLGGKWFSLKRELGYWKRLATVCPAEMAQKATSHLIFGSGQVIKDIFKRQAK